MKFALVEGARRQAEPSLKGQCPRCDAVTIAKCGRQRIWHWAHRGIRNCDPWWENETDWHRAWKNHFPEKWQEFLQRSGSDEKHVADVKTQSGLVIEFQHSPLPQGERLARETFYRNMIWVVDGRKRKRDRAQFFAALKAAVVASLHPPVIAVSFPSEVALLRDWLESSVPGALASLARRGGDSNLDSHNMRLWNSSHCRS
jgi:competence protein CoiA